MASSAFITLATGALSCIYLARARDSKQAPFMRPARSGGRPSS